MAGRMQVRLKCHACMEVAHIYIVCMPMAGRIRITVQHSHNMQPEEVKWGGCLVRRSKKGTRCYAAVRP